jgi:hypothetical protein
MRRWVRWLVLPAVAFSCATAMAASGDAPSDRGQASTAASPKPDIDRDGLSDSAEVRRYHTDPRKRDTDGDRVNDGAEVDRYHTNPRRPDTDRDGLPDGDEVKRYHTDPRRRDTDRDGLRDGDEVAQYKTNPRKPDTDGDGLRDSDEINQSKTDPSKPDTDGDGFGDGVEFHGGTNPLNARSHLGYPDASNTGVPAGTTLTPVDSLTVRTNNTVVSAIQMTGCVTVEAVNVTIKNSKIGCVRVENPADAEGAQPVTIQDTEIVCPIGNWNTGIRFNNFNAIRVNIHGCENGLDMFSHATIRDSYIHDLACGGDYHTDGIQSGDGSNTVIQHNTIISCDTSAININNTPGGVVTNNVLITENKLAMTNGSYTIYCPITPPTNFRITNNAFAASPNFGDSTDCAGGEAWSGNVRYATGDPVAP